MSRLLRLHDVLDAIGIRKSQLYKLVKDGSFPQPVKIGRASAWPESEIGVWINQRVAERDGDVRGANKASPSRIPESQ